MKDVSLFSGFIGFVIAIVLFIVFINMASNLRTIRITLFDLLNVTSGKSLYLAEREEWKGNKQKAIDYYLNYLYGIKRGKVLFRRKDKTQRIDSILNKIKDLGVELPATGIL